MIKGDSCKTTICGNHCLNLCNRNKDNEYCENDDLYHLRICKHFHTIDERKLLQFTKCGCNTHWLCLMDLINNYKKDYLECPSCGILILDQRNRKETEYDNLFKENLEENVKLLSLRSIVGASAIDILSNGNSDDDKHIFKISDVLF